MRLRKITVISGITLRAHFSLGIVKIDTLSNLLLTLGIRVPLCVTDCMLRSSQGCCR